MSWSAKSDHAYGLARSRRHSLSLFSDLDRHTESCPAGTGEVFQKSGASACLHARAENYGSVPGSAAGARLEARGAIRRDKRLFNLNGQTASFSPLTRPGQKYILDALLCWHHSSKLFAGVSPAILLSLAADADSGIQQLPQLS